MCGISGLLYVQWFDFVYDAGVLCVPWDRACGGVMTANKYNDVMKNINLELKRVSV